MGSKRQKGKCVLPEDRPGCCSVLLEDRPACLLQAHSGHPRSFIASSRIVRSTEVFINKTGSLNKQESWRWELEDGESLVAG